MSELSTGALFVLLIFLLFLSAFFSSSETSMMALNRYRLRHLAENGKRGAINAQNLLERPDRLIGLILLGNNFVNILASVIATILGLRLFDEAGPAIAAGLLTFVILIFAEVMPKTMAAVYPERIAFPASFGLNFLLKAFYPLVFLVNSLTNNLLKLLGVDPQNHDGSGVTREELRMVVKEAESMIPRRHQNMLFAILDLEKVTVEDIMIPQSEVVGVDMEDDPVQIIDQLVTYTHTRTPIYNGNINELVGILHVRRIPRFIEFLKNKSGETLEDILLPPYFVPISTPLHTQLSNFQRETNRMALVVDEYGNIEGLTTLEDILEEIVGEFTTDPQSYSQDIQIQEDGSYIIDGSTNLRYINRSLKWKLPISGAKTLNGLILEYLESIPESGTSMRIAGYTIEIVSTSGQQVKVVNMQPVNPDKT